MSSPQEPSPRRRRRSRTKAIAVGRPHSRIQNGYFLLEGLNALATAYYFNYLFFYMREHFGFGNPNNLLITALYGFLYMFSAWYAGRIAQKYGYILMLRLGFAGMMLAMILGGVIPFAFHYSHTALVAEFVVLTLWTVSICFTWPMLQSLVCQGQSATELPRTAGIYNVVWAVAAAFAYFSGGALLDWLGGEVLIFWLPAGMHLLQLILLAQLQKFSIGTIASQPTVETPPESVPQLTPRPIAKSRTFLMLAWIANPFAYVAIYGILPVIPKLSEHLGLSDTSAGVICSVWLWMRLGAFIWFWLWPGWHYSFRWLFGAFVALIASFAVVLLVPHVWTLVVAQIVFGLAVGLIYYSSLYYSMDSGASSGKQGGIHEAAIGLGIFLGPAVGVTALRIFPKDPNAGTWNICGLLIVGLLIFLFVPRRSANTTAA